MDSNGIRWRQVASKATIAIASPEGAAPDGRSDTCISVPAATAPPTHFDDETSFDTAREVSIKRVHCYLAYG